MKVFTKKFWQIQYANISMFMFQWCYTPLNAFKCLLAIPYFIIVLPPMLLLSYISSLEKFLRNTGLPWFCDTIGLRIEENPEWIKMSWHQKVERWKI